MPKPAFIVDGFMEKKILEKLCPGSKITRANCNGEAVNMGVLAKRIIAQLPLLKNYRPIIIIFDRETREESCEELVLQLRDHITAAGFKENLVFGAADRCVESWILADWNSVRQRQPELSEYTGTPEGSRGKLEIRKLLPENVGYTETIEGVKWFCMTRSSNISERSASFRALKQAIDVPCHWLEM